MLNEPIMRRGLSPEGQIIRQKHQSSLLNDEFGVTSHPIHRKIEKDFLKENVKKLKEIQAKCRVQESRPISGNYPFKALRVNSLPNPAICGKDKINSSLIVDNKSTIRERGGSAHSDYFSLTDETPTELNDLSDELSKESHHSCITVNDIITKEPMTADVTNENQENVLQENTLLPLHSFSDDSFSSKEPNSSNIGDVGSLKLLRAESIATKISRVNHSLAHNWKNDKLKELIEKIKNKKPACDIQARNLWRDIEKQHKALLGYEENLSVCTPRSSIGSYRPTTAMRVSKHPGKINRSLSLDRVTSLKRSRRTDRLDPNTSINNSQSSDNISLTSASCKPFNDFIKVKKPLTCNSTGLGEFMNGKKTFRELNDCSELKNYKYYFTSNPELLTANRCQEGDFYEMTGTLSHSHNNDSERQFSNENRSNICQPIFNSADNVNNTKCIKLIKEELPNKTSFAPIITKKLSPVPIYKQNILAKQRSLFLRSKSASNLRITGEPPPTYKRGHIPKYLLARKEETQRMLEAAAAIDPMCPPGHTPLPEHERKNTLLLLKKGLSDVMQQLSSLPVAQDTLRLRKLKQELEMKLNQIEEGIQIFSQPKVYVINDE